MGTRLKVDFSFTAPAYNRLSNIKQKKKNGEEIKMDVFILKTHQMVSVHTTPKKLQKRVILDLLKKKIDS